MLRVHLAQLRLPLGITSAVKLAGNTLYGAKHRRGSRKSWLRPLPPQLRLPVSVLCPQRAPHTYRKMEPATRKEDGDAGGCAAGARGGTEEETHRRAGGWPASSMRDASLAG
jgi:hypothetical protein